MATISSAQEYHEDFDPVSYLSDRYGSKVDKFDHEVALQTLHELYSEGASGLKILEVGCGPVIIYQISAAPFASEIVMAELVRSNRDHVQLWLDKNPGAYDWTPFFRYVVQTLEGKGQEAVTERKEQLRNAVKAVIHCDVTKDPPVPQGYEGPYDIVLESVGLDAVCNNEVDYAATLTRLSKLLKPGGKLICKMYLMEGLDTNTYTYDGGGGKIFTVWPLSEMMLRSALQLAGFSNVVVKRSPTNPNDLATRQGATYSGMVMVSAVK